MLGKLVSRKRARSNHVHKFWSSNEPDFVLTYRGREFGLPWTKCTIRLSKVLTCELQAHSMWAVARTRISWLGSVVNGHREICESLAITCESLLANISQMTRKYSQILASTRKLLANASQTWMNNFKFPLCVHFKWFLEFNFSYDDSHTSSGHTYTEDCYSQIARKWLASDSQIFLLLANNLTLLASDSQVTRKFSCARVMDHDIWSLLSTAPSEPRQKMLM